MSLTTKRFIFGIIVTAFAIAGMACGDNIEFVAPLDASASDPSPDASTTDGGADDAESSIAPR